MTNKTIPRLSDLKNPIPEINGILEKVIESELTRLREKSKHPLSWNLPDNLSTRESDYDAVLNEYGSSAHKSNRGQRDFLDDNNINLGWKLHLNVKPENVKAVSDYLIENEYLHKYRDGGEIDNGKVFTVYVGSRKKTEEVAATLSQDLIVLLSKPVDYNEVEFAAGVVGRFSTGIGFGEFKKYGTAGMDTLKSAWGNPLEVFQHPHSPEKIREIELKTFQRLCKLYGVYFTGESSLR